MSIVLGTPVAADVGDVLATLGRWQRDDVPVQLHPGDVGWYGRFGPEAVASAVRTWSRGGEIVAIGLLDGADTLRLTTTPEAARDEDLARRMAADIANPDRGVLPAGAAAVEIPTGSLVHDLLGEVGWEEDTDEPWSPLRRDLAEPVGEAGLRVEVVGPELVAVRTAVHRAAFGKVTFTDALWRAMASGPAYADARCLLAFDEHDEAVAAATVWSAGPGRPGLLEPVGVHPDHRGRRYGTAISLAAASTLRDLGASSALVCTPTSLTGAVATYRSAGFDALPRRLDRRRP